VKQTNHWSKIIINYTFDGKDTTLSQYTCRCLMSLLQLTVGKFFIYVSTLLRQSVFGYALVIYKESITNSKLY